LAFFLEENSEFEANLGDFDEENDFKQVQFVKGLTQI
jgi:uncharacterized protein YozE (UPF0346 family)